MRLAGCSWPEWSCSFPRAPYKRPAGAWQGACCAGVIHVVADRAFQVLPAGAAPLASCATLQCSQAVSTSCKPSILNGLLQQGGYIRGSPTAACHFSICLEPCRAPSSALRHILALARALLVRLHADALQAARHGSGASLRAGHERAGASDHCCEQKVRAPAAQRACHSGAAAARSCAQLGHDPVRVLVSCASGSSGHTRRCRRCCLKAFENVSGVQAGSCALDPLSLLTLLPLDSCSRTGSH